MISKFNYTVMSFLLLCLTLAGCSTDDAFYLSLNYNDKSIQVDDTFQFIAKSQNTKDDLNETVKWSLIEMKDASGAAASVASIDQKGKVTGLMPGTAKVKAEVADGQYAIAYLTVTKRVAPENGMTFAKREIYTSIDNTKSDTLELLVDSTIPKHFNVTVTSDNEQIIKPTLIKKDATTYKVALNLGGKEGTCIITAKAGEVTTSATIHVGVKLYLSFEKINNSLGEPSVVSLGSFTFNIGTTNVIPVHFLSIPDDQSHLEKLEFYVSSSGSSIFKSVSQRVDLENKIVYIDVAVGSLKGDANIVVESMGQKVTAECNVMDKNDVDVKSITFNPSVITTTLKSMDLYEKVTIKPLAAAALWPAVYKSSDESVATVDASGLAHFLKKGKVVITATAKDKSATCEITTLIEASSVIFESAANELYVGESSQYTAKIITNYDNQTGLVKSWSSSNTGVATVDANGKVTAVGVGKATITLAVTDDLGKTYTATKELTVKDNASANIFDLDFNSKKFNWTDDGASILVYDPALPETDPHYYSFHFVDMNGNAMKMKEGTYTVGTDISTKSTVLYNELNETAYLQSGTLTVQSNNTLVFNLVVKEGSKTVTIKGSVAKG